MLLGWANSNRGPGTAPQERVLPGLSWLSFVLGVGTACARAGTRDPRWHWCCGARTACGATG